MNRLRFFWNTSYIISGYVFTLDDIENGVLRGNRKGPAHIFRQFSSKSDPRLRFALPKPEPLIHFALVCGAKSCPPIKCYTEAKVKEELRIAAEVNISKYSVTSAGWCSIVCPSIFKGYKLYRITVYFSRDSWKTIQMFLLIWKRKKSLYP